MVSIFYDLETTHLSPLGQILNCCFVAVDRSWKELGRYSAELAISPLQLPEPEAVLANRTQVMSHQLQASKSERQALKEVHSFIGDTISRSGEAVELIGYNSARFDLNFLRTSFIRNGLNPYFYGKVVPKDLLHTVRYLSVTNASFPRCPRTSLGETAGTKLSLGLEPISQALGLLSDKQRHHSAADVDLTILLAKTLVTAFGVDVRTHSAYPAAELHAMGRAHPVVVALTPQLDLQSPLIASRRPFSLLTNDGKSGLWIDLLEYREGKGRDAIKWMSTNSRSLLIDLDDVASQAYTADAIRARDQFRDINLSTFFHRSTCDIEADIFRLSFSEIESLESAIWTGNKLAISNSDSKDIRELYIRNRLSELDWSCATESQEQRLAAYALYRYGGACNIQKGHIGTLDPSLHEAAAHHTFAYYLDRLKTLQASATNPEEREILDQLGVFYQSSPISRVAGRQLLDAVRLPLTPRISTGPGDLDPRARPHMLAP